MRAHATALLFGLLAASAASSASAQTDSGKILAAARAEGTVVVSGPPGEVQRQVITGDWAKAHPDIALQYTAARGTQILAKVVRERESGLYNWDAILSSTDPTVFTLIPVNALAPFREAMIEPALLDDKTWLGGFAAGLMDDAKKFFYSPTGKTEPTLGFVNRDCVSKEVLSRAEDLKKPELIGKIAWFDPLQPGSGSRSNWLLSVDKGEDWLKDLFKNHGIVFARDYRQLTDWLVNCTKPVVGGIATDVLYQMQQNGIGLHVEELAGPAYFGTQKPRWAGANEDVGWYNNAPHPNAAKLFVSWYLSKDLQQHYADANRTNSRRTDTTPGDPDPTHALQPGVQYECWGDESSIRQLRALQDRIKSWGVLG